MGKNKDENPRRPLDLEDLKKLRAVTRWYVFKKKLVTLWYVSKERIARLFTFVVSIPGRIRNIFK